MTGHILLMLAALAASPSTSRGPADAGACPVLAAAADAGPDRARPQPPPVAPIPSPTDTLHVTVSGRGETVVLVPGLLGSGYAFRNVVPLLNQAGFRTVVVDLLGTGRSSRRPDADYSLEAQAARIAGVLDTLGVRRARMVAHSLGGSVVLRLAARRPDLVSSVLLLEAGAAETAATDGLRKALKFRPLIRLLGSGPVKGRMRDQMVSASGDPGWVSDDVVDGYARTAMEDLGGTLDAFRGMAESTEPEPLAPRLGRIRQPVRLLLGGAPHPGGPPDSEIRRLRQGLPDFTCDTVPGVGHFPHEEAPELVLAAVIRMRGAPPVLAAPQES